MSKHHLLVMQEPSSEIFYSETYHSEGEYLAGLFRLAVEFAPFRDVKLAYIPPGEKKALAFRTAKIREIAAMVKAAGLEEGGKASPPCGRDRRVSEA